MHPNNVLSAKLRTEENRAATLAVEERNSATPSGKNDLQLRALAHDLSNALDTVLQASYLLSQSKLPPAVHAWAEMIDSAAQQAARLNQEMQELLRSSGKPEYREASTSVAAVGKTASDRPQKGRKSSRPISPK
jgi:signal transduction histidine kinase